MRHWTQRGDQIYTTDECHRGNGMSSLPESTEETGLVGENGAREEAATRHTTTVLDRIKPRLKMAHAVLVSLAAAGAVASGLLGYWTVWKTLKTEIFHEVKNPQKYAASQPDIIPRLSLVVLSFANLNNDPEQDYFADGITTDLTTDLGRIPGAFVIGRGTAFTYKNKQFDLRTLGKELGVRWAVQGSVQRSGDHVRVNVSLTDLSTGGDFWSDRFDGERSNLADLQDQIVVRLARSLSIELIQAESRRGQSERPANPDAIDLSMRGWAKFYEPRTQVHIREASELFESALHLDPDDADAMIGKSWCLLTNVLNKWSASPDADLRIAAGLIDRAFARRPPNALAHVVKGNLLRFGDPEAALAEYDAALEVDPNYPPAHFYKGIELTELGRARAALSSHQIALRLSPKDPLAAYMHYGLCHAHLHLREYAEAADECGRAVNLNQGFWYAYVDLVVAYGATGRAEQSKRALAELYRIRPEFTIQGFQQLAFSLSPNPQFRKEVAEIIVDGLVKAGAKEQ
jgi:adenylate cyclase